MSYGNANFGLIIQRLTTVEIFPTPSLGNIHGCRGVVLVFICVMCGCACVTV